jgi:superfamily II helicase
MNQQTMKQNKINSMAKALYCQEVEIGFRGTSIVTTRIELLFFSGRKEYDLANRS